MRSPNLEQAKVQQQKPLVRRVVAGLLVASVLIASGLFGPAPTFAATHEVRVTSEGFVPNAVTIKKDDTVVWVWESGSHTVTNGKSPDDENAGLILDMAINSRTQRVEFTFSDIAVYDYFSRTRPDFRGTVTVQDGTPVDPATWGFIKKMFEDPAAPLSRLR